VFLIELGYCYRQEAKKSLSRFLGVEGLFAGVREQAHMIKEVAKASIAAVEMQHEILELQRVYEQQGETSQEAQEAIQRRMLEKGRDSLFFPTLF